MRTRTCECVPSATATPDGILYVAWYERTPIGGTEGGTDVLFARSDDAGVTWTTGTAASLPHQAFLPVVAVARDGTVGITYYDLRNDKAGDAELTTDVWLAYSSDEGASWRELHVAGPFDLRTAPNLSGYFLGDYHGLVGLPDGFGALFAMARPQAKTGPSDVFYAKITLG